MHNGNKTTIQRTNSHLLVGRKPYQSVTAAKKREILL